MPRFYLRLALLPIMLLTAALLIIHAQPYDDRELRELLMPEGCPAPCFMGIRPGVTTMDEAMKLLEASDLVKDVKNETVGIYWRWDKLNPNWINSQDGGQIYAMNSLKLIDTITLYTNISIGEIQLTFGKPDMELVARQDQMAQNIFYFAAFNQYGLSIQNQIPCESFEPFRTPIFVNISEPVNYEVIITQGLNNIFRVC